ncbi:tetratricopeptide repeat protein, partial [bacterium]|nr:tetratricopeptide repeat protein [bacterium]
MRELKDIKDTFFVKTGFGLAMSACLLVWPLQAGWAQEEAASAEVKEATKADAGSVQEQRDINFADGLYQRGLYSSAAKLYKEFLENYPESGYRDTAMFRRGESLYQQATAQEKEDPVNQKILLIEARNELQQVMEEYPKSEKRHEALLRIGEISYKIGDYNEGGKTLRQVIEQTKDAGLKEAATFYSARCYQMLKKYKEAEAQYQQIRKGKKTGEYAGYATFLLANMLTDQGETERATRLYRDLWQNPKSYGLKPGSSLIEESQLQAAQILYKTERFQEASEAYQAYIKSTTDARNVAKAKYGAAWSEYRNKNYAKALEIAESLQKQALPPELAAGILFLEGTCSYQQKDYEDAILYFREVIADPKAGEYRDRAWYQLCWSYYLSKKYDRTIAECEALLQQAIPRSMGGNVHFLMGQAYSRKQNFDEAIRQMQFVLDLASSGEYAREALFLKADLLYRKKSYAEAGEAFEGYYETYPKSPRAEDALQWAVNAYYSARVFDQAIKVSTELLETFPQIENRAEIVYRKALALYQIKEYKAALAHFDQLLQNGQKDPNDADAMYWKAYILELQNNRREAARIYGELLKVHPSFKNARDVQLRKALCEYQIKEFASAYRGFLSVIETEMGKKIPSEVIFWMVFFADQNDKHKEALSIAERILELFEQPEIQERALIAKGNQLVALERWEPAQKNAELFLERFAESQFKPEIYW